MPKSAAAPSPGLIPAPPESKPGRTFAFRGSAALAAAIDEVLAQEQRGSHGLKLSSVLQWLMEAGLDLYAVLQEHAPEVEALEAQGLTRTEALERLVSAGAAALAKPGRRQ